MATTSTETAKKTHQGRGYALLSGVFSVLGLAALAVIAYALVQGHSIVLKTTDQITQVLTLGVVLSGAALVLGVVGLIVGLVALLRSRSRARTVGAAVSLLVALCGGLFLFTTALPRAQAVQNLNDHVVPFARALNTYCQTPLNNTTADFQHALNDTEATISDNASFASAMQGDVSRLNADATALSAATLKLQALTAPDAKYQQLLHDCMTTVQGTHDFLVNDAGANAIPLPAPYAALVPGGKVSGIDLLQDAGAAAGGLLPLHLPEGAIQPLVEIALKQVVNTTNPTLTAEGNQLKADIQATLNTNLSPFVVDVPLS